MATYYVDPTVGGPGTGTLLDPFHAWNHVTWAAGNTYLQKRGTISNAQITIGATGTAGNIITLGAYGSGAKPQIKPSTALTSWTQVGVTEVYYAALATGPKVVKIGSVYVQPAHWPTTSGSDPAVFEYPSGNSANATHLTDALLHGHADTDLIGAQVNIYINDYQQKKAIISAWDDTTHILTIASVTSSPATSMRYYLTAPAATGRAYADKAWMMTENTWFYDTDAQRLYVWKTGGGDPGTVDASSANYCIYAVSRNYITIDSLDCRMANSIGIFFDTSGANPLTDLIVTNCDVSDVFGQGIYMWGTPTATITRGIITNNTIQYCNESAVRVSYGINNIINTNDISNLGIYPMLPGPPSGIYTSYMSGSYTCFNNIVSNTAYSGIEDIASTSTTTISFNTINHDCIYLTDGGGIYTSSMGGTISYNSLVGGYGYGLYADTGASGIIFEYNSVDGLGLSGSLIHLSGTCTIRNNFIVGPFVQSAVILSLGTAATYTGNKVYSNYINGVDKVCNGIRVLDYPNSAVDVYNNTIVNCAIGLWATNDAAILGTVQNNIFYNNTTHIKTYTGAQGTVSYNCYYGVGNWIFDVTTDTAYASWKTTSSLDATGSINSDPLLSDYILLPCSPCIRAGLTIEAITNDVDGRKRPGRPGNKYSIGCWEYLGTNDPDHDENCRLPYR